MWPFKRRKLISDELIILQLAEMKDEFETFRSTARGALRNLGAQVTALTQRVDVLDSTVSQSLNSAYDRYDPIVRELSEVRQTLVHVMNHVDMDPRLLPTMVKPHNGDPDGLDDENYAWLDGDEEAKT